MPILFGPAAPIENKQIGLGSSQEGCVKYTSVQKNDKQ